MSNGRFVFDTNIFILFFNDRLLDPLPTGEITCSIITEMELLSFPALTLAEETLIRDSLATLMVYDIDSAVKEGAIRLRRSQRLRLPDAIIAATALVHGATLVSNDKGVQAIQGLTWRELALRP